MTAKLDSTERARLRRFFVDRFSLDELKDLAFDLGVDSEFFSHEKKQAFSRELIEYFDHRDQLGCLITEALKQRPENDLMQVLAKLPASAPSVKIQIIVSVDLVEDISGFLDELAARLKVTKEEVVLVGAARGSLRLLIGLPRKTADLQVLGKIHSLGNGKYPIVSIIIFDSLDSVRQKAWRLASRDYPPICQGNILRPVASWQDTLKVTRRDQTTSHTNPSERLRIGYPRVNMEPITTPAYRLVEQVWQNEFSFEKALEQVVSPSNLAQVNTSDINDTDRFIRTLAEQDLKQATILAILNREVALRKGNTAIQGKCSNTLGWLYLRQDQLERALKYYQEALDLLENIPQAQSAIARIRLDIGEINERQNNWDAARLEYQAALASAQELGRPTLESDAHNGLGRVHLALEETDEALAAFDLAWKMSRQVHDKRGRETALGNLGKAYHYLGRLKQAHNRFKQALYISRSIGHTAGTGRHLNHLGSVSLDLGELGKAEECYSEALQIARENGDLLGEQQRLGNLGNLYRDWAKRETTSDQRNARLVTAQTYHQDALALARERHDRRNQCDHLLNLGNVYIELGQFKEAHENYTAALQLAREQNVIDTRWRVHYALGKLRDEQERGRLARYHYHKAIDIVEQQRSKLHIESRTKFWQERSLLYKRMMLSCLRGNDLWSALEHTERAKARYLADLLSQNSIPTGSTLDTIRAVLQALPERTAVVVFNVTEAGTVVFIVTGQPCEALKGSDDPGWQLSPDHHIRAKLIEEFDRDSLERLLVQRDESGQPRGYLTEYYAHRNDIEKWQPTFDKVSITLARFLLMPVHRQLKQLQIERLVLIPNLGLSVLPLHACNLADGNKPDYVLDHYEITYAPSFDVLRHCQNQARGQVAQGISLLAIANPTQDLPWAEFEVGQIASLFKVRVLDSSKSNLATPEAVLAEAPHHAILHFACHGKSDLRDPLQSALTLAAEAPLTAKTILSQLQLPHAHLVVMNACETGLVDPGDLADEYMGLPAGFLQACAPTVVSSLWTVDDISTALLMIRFYQYYLKGDANKGLGPMRPGLALRRAQEWLRNELTTQEVTTAIEQLRQKYEAEDNHFMAGELASMAKELANQRGNEGHTRPFAHPYYWAAFTVVGTA